MAFHLDLVRVEMVTDGKSTDDMGLPFKPKRRKPIQS
jgi:hypothetical protein